MTFSKTILMMLMLLSVPLVPAQSQIKVNMTLSIKGTAASIEFEMDGQKLATDARSVTINRSGIYFVGDFQGAELRFEGKFTGAALAGTLEVIEKGKLVANGSWAAARTDPESTLNGTWIGSFIAVPKPAQQVDPRFDTTIKYPAYTRLHPRVLFDGAHNNTHTAAGLYKPFADLITNDGYEVLPNPDRFTPTSLRGFDVLVIVNATGPRGQRSSAAFTEEECKTVQEWVHAGGSLLLIADHTPMGAAADILARSFGVEMSKVFTDYPSSNDHVLGDITFSRNNKLLADSPITNGRNAQESVNTVITFTGQSLKGPAESISILTLPATAVDRDPKTNQIVSAAGHSQGLSMEYGRGRVVVLGEAAMLTAQIDDEGRIFGMNYPGNDNRQFALNIMHWLSGLMK